MCECEREFECVCERHRCVRDGMCACVRLCMKECDCECERCMRILVCELKGCVCAWEWECKVCECERVCGNVSVRGSCECAG